MIVKHMGCSFANALQQCQSEYAHVDLANGKFSVERFSDCFHCYLFVVLARRRVVQSLQVDLRVASVASNSINFFSMTQQSKHIRFLDRQCNFFTYLMQCQTTQG